MQTRDFDFYLPPDLIAQHPATSRDQSRLLVWNRAASIADHRRFNELPGLLRPRDLLVINDSKVIQARLRAANPRSGGHFEILLLEQVAPNDWWTMMRPGKRARLHTEIILLDAAGHPSSISAAITAINDEGHRRLRFTGTANILNELPRLGEMPLPPYIRRPRAQAEDAVRYQTVYARHEGSVAAPTAGLHFTDSLLQQIRNRGIDIATVTLHVGPGTFAPVKAENLAGHVMHRERYSIPPDTARRVNEARKSGKRIVAVGTTSLRVLESAAREGRVEPGDADTRLFVYPPYSFQIVDALLTNFHLPCSTLLMLVSAFLTPDKTEGRDQLLRCYAEAVERRYRFFSYGDAMLIE